MRCGPVSPAPDPDVDGTVERFREAICSLHPSPGSPIGLAVSGGPDSMALLALCDRLWWAGEDEDFCSNFEVATIDHGLRADAADECVLVKGFCDQRQIRCEVIKVAVAEGNVQEQARIARYTALGQWAVERKLAAIVTAHHADDQAETVMMRLNRGSGLEGLAAIRKRGQVNGCAVPVLRPLLSFRRSELRQIVDGMGVPFALDPSNENEDFERVRIRRALADAAWLDPGAVARSAAQLEEVLGEIAGICHAIWQQKASVTAGRVCVPASGWVGIDARVISKGIAELGGKATVGGLVVLLKDGLAISGRKANIAGFLIEHLEDVYLITPEPPRRTG
jgi:tRNA(Ile)-lysidine synthase